MVVGSYKGNSMSDDAITYFHPPESEACRDPVVECVLEKLRLRSLVGHKKYGSLMDRTDLDTLAWLRHAQEEALDLAVYLERLQYEFWLRADDGK